MTPASTSCERCTSDLTGRAVRSGTPVEGRAFIMENLDMASRIARASRRSGSAAPRAQHQQAERAWFAVDDPVPFVSMAVRQAGPSTNMPSHD
jgi:hypothetical protein